MLLHKLCYGKETQAQKEAGNDKLLPLAACPNTQFQVLVEEDFSCHQEWEEL